MALSRPVVASRLGGLGEAVVHDRTGLLVPPGDPEALAQALAQALATLIASEERRRPLGDEGPRRVAEGYLAEQMVEACEGLYREVLEESAD